MTTRTAPPFRADHVGSLLRPPELLAARARHRAGDLDAAGLRAVEDDAIRAVVAMQEEVGLQSATDGEFRRTSWHMDFIYALGGVTTTDAKIQVHMRNATGQVDFESAAMRVSEPITLRETIFGEAFDFLQAQVHTATPKLTIPSPSMVHYRGGRASIDESVYPDLEQFWDDLTAPTPSRSAGSRRRAAGTCSWMTPAWPTSTIRRSGPSRRPPVATPSTSTSCTSATSTRRLQAVRTRSSVTTHMCRGNYRSSWAAEGGYDFVAEALFGQLDVDGFFLEFDDERSGSFAPLRFVPPGKQVVLGLVTTKRGELEDKDALKRRIDEASRYVPLEQLCLSPQCGFSSTVEGNALTQDEQKAKLALIVETAAEVWG